MAHDHVALARRWFEEIWNERRGDLIEELLSPEGVCMAAGGPMCGPQEFRERAFGPFLEAFPDLHVTVEGTVAQGNEVVVRWTAAGTHTGPGLGFSATGRPIFLRGMTWIRFQDGKMVEGWDCWDQTGLIESLRVG